LTPRRAQNSSGSRLIEFPRRPQTGSDSQAINQPAWKAELTERVRAAKARRNGGKTSDQIVEEIPPEAVRERETVPSKRGIELAQPDTTRIIESSRNQAVAARLSVEQPAPGSEKLQPQSQKPSVRANDQIVEAALSRARRASENASRAVLAESTSTSSRTTTKTTPAVEREATARALAPTEDVKPRTDIIPATVSQIAPQPSPVSLPVTETVETRSVLADLDLTLDELPVSSPIDDIEPRDYLAAEIKKVDRELSEQFAHNESPGLFAHVVLNVVDFLVISLSVAPFLALIVIYNGSLFDRPTQVAGTTLILVVTLFYLALTQTVCGRTFGMMLTNTRLVDARSFEAPSPQRALVRSAAYFLASLPALLGIVWLIFNRKHRGWHDYLSGTMVARDF
jgi:uncharacterized RDD family membrane protein YckC